MEFFVEKNSIVRRIWGNGDTILFIFAGASAEFALNKAVDWLYFTGKLPGDPIGRLFSTVAYARLIVFSEKDVALRAIDKMTAIHAGVEAKRGSSIPDWAYRDVLFMLIDYSIRAYELLERKLSVKEKRDVFEVFKRVGQRMQLKGLPQHYEDWVRMRKDHLEHNLEKSEYTTDLFNQYLKHLGYSRYLILREAQLLVVPEVVRRLLNLGKVSTLKLAIPVYKMSRRLKVDRLIKAIILPGAYKDQIKALDVL